MDFPNAGAIMTDTRKDIAIPKAVSIKKELYDKACMKADELGLSFSQLVCILLKKEIKNKEDFILQRETEEEDLSKF